MRRDSVPPALTDPRGPCDVLWRVASQQRGYFTAAQASEAGYSYQAQRFHAQRGNWFRVDRGIYRFREYSDMPSDAPSCHIPALSPFTISARPTPRGSI
ncbi:MAG: type IV toxin-antitoxin system AbiEi family antitoxin domain-containing protein [Pseudonocardiaceae bacterium]